MKKLSKEHVIFPCRLQRALTSGSGRKGVNAVPVGAAPVRARL
jgi:hypothetical protein